MKTITIKMSATPSSQGPGSLPKSVEFSPAGQLTEEVGTGVIFEVEPSLLTYINDSSVDVTFTWQGTEYPLLNLKELSVGEHGDQYFLSITSKELGGSNSTTTSGDIIVC